MTANDIYEIVSWAIVTFAAYYYAIKLIVKIIKEKEQKSKD